MRKSFMVAVMEILFVGMALGQGKSGLCDRRCLEGFVNQYLAALAAHDASKAPFASNIRYTENAKILPITKPTEGLWATLTRLEDYKFYVADPKVGQVAYVGLVKEGDKTALLSMRLRIENKKITEVESVVVRNMNEGNLWTLKTPPAEFSRALAPEERVSREELVRISSVYFVKSKAAR